ncbi:MAG: DUF4325 domain-containing protein [Patescibacteria group bacterium]|jgi:anti-sigma regulatory factor (Ser/Thr protein kinase)/biotin operon repressor
MSTKDRALAFIKEKRIVTGTELSRHLGVSRAFTHRVLQELREEGSVQVIGNTRQAHYVSADDKQSIEAARFAIRKISFKLTSVGLDESLVFERIERSTGIFMGVSENVHKLVRFAFTEMLNNAIDHSGSEEILVECRRTDTAIVFTVRDFGIGIFNNVRKTRRLPNTMAAIEDLLKGKVTTMPERHSGEGVFFTSKSADTFVAESFEKKLTVTNLVSDMFISDRRPILKGTLIIFTISLKSPRTLVGVFKAFTVMDDNGSSFSKTRVLIKLYERSNTFLSRSEAKRVLVNLEHFEEVELDFHKVETVGQAFADEIFRVWKKSHPNVRLMPINMSENVKFMVRRAGGI